MSYRRAGAGGQAGSVECPLSAPCGSGLDPSEWELFPSYPCWGSTPTVCPWRGSLSGAASGDPLSPASSLWGGGAGLSPWGGQRPLQVWLSVLPTPQKRC